MHSSKMLHYNSAKSSIAVASALVLLFASFPSGHAVLQPITGLLSIAQVQFSGRVVCTASGNPPASGGALGAAGMVVSGSCPNGAAGDLAQALTDAEGFYFGIISLGSNILFNFNVSNGMPMPCKIVVKLPATGTSCQVFPPTGSLEAAVKALRLVSNLTGELTLVVGALPFGYVAV